ncbi:MAG: ATP-dependent Clp protease adapter ClpS [Desulfobulbaceae bacterium]
MKIVLTNSLSNMGNKTSVKEKTFIRDKEELKEPPLYKVLLHNDDYTTMDFVVMILETVFKKDKGEAIRIMLNVHHQGLGIAGVYTREIGETKIAVVHGLARKQQFPLRCSLEKLET